MDLGGSCTQCICYKKAVSELFLLYLFIADVHMLHYITSHMLHQCPALFVFKISSLWLKNILITYLFITESVWERGLSPFISKEGHIKVAGSKLAAQLLWQAIFFLLTDSAVQLWIRGCKLGAANLGQYVVMVITSSILTALTYIQHTHPFSQLHHVICVITCTLFLAYPIRLYSRICSQCCKQL